MRVYGKLYIDGHWTPSSAHELIEVINASTEQVMGSIPAGTGQLRIAELSRTKRNLAIIFRIRVASVVVPSSHGAFRTDEVASVDRFGDVSTSTARHRAAQ